MTNMLTGGCQCGQARFEVHGSRLAFYVCHCRECQKQLASAFGVSVIVRSADLRLTSGELKSWSRRTDSGRELACFFCSVCGTRLWHGDRETSKTVSVKGGALDAPPDLSGAVHIWTSRKLPGVLIPADAVQFSAEPA
jgi:hypothetical protein